MCKKLLKHGSLCSDWLPPLFLCIFDGVLNCFFSGLRCFIELIKFSKNSIDFLPQLISFFLILSIFQQFLFWQAIFKKRLDRLDLEVLVFLSGIFDSFLKRGEGNYGWRSAKYKLSHFISCKTECLSLHLYVFNFFFTNTWRLLKSIKKRVDTTDRGLHMHLKVNSFE